MSDVSGLIAKRAVVLGGWRGALFTELCALVSHTDSTLIAEWKWDTAVWSSHGLVCAAGAFKDNVGLNFFQGAKLPDPHKLFNAGLEAKLSRSVRFYEGEPVDKSAIKELIRAAIALNAAKK
jgi:hypothetical protein